MADKQIARERLAHDSFIHSKKSIIHDFNARVTRILVIRKILKTPYIYDHRHTHLEFQKATIWQGLNLPRNVFNPTIFTSPRKGMFILVPLKGHPNATLVIPVSFKYDH